MKQTMGPQIEAIIRLSATVQSNLKITHFLQNTFIDFQTEPKLTFVLFRLVDFKIQK